VAKYSDGCWYRGLIISVDDTKHVAQIFFIDYGNLDPIIYSNLREIPRKYLKPTAHAFLCEIINIRPPNDQTWSRSTELVDKITDRLTELSAEEKLFARIKKEKNHFKIDVYQSDPTNRTVPGKHVFQDFVDKGLLVYSDPRAIWRKPIEATQSYKSSQNLFINIKPEPKD